MSSSSVKLRHLPTGQPGNQLDGMYSLRGVVPLFFNLLARIIEPSNDDYDNGVSDNCDQNFGTFDDFGVKNDQKVSHNMILMSKYKGQHGGKTVATVY